MVLDHPGDYIAHRWYCRKYTANTTGSADSLRRFNNSAISGTGSFYQQVFVDMGRNCCHFIDIGLHDPCLGHKKVWWYQIWNLGMRYRLFTGILDGPSGYDNRAFHWCFCGRDDCRAGFQKVVQSSRGFICRFFIGNLFKIGYLLCNGLLSLCQYLEECTASPDHTRES